MDDQSTESTMPPAQNEMPDRVSNQMPSSAPMKPAGSGGTAYVIGTVVIIIVIALGLWYYVSMPAAPAAVAPSPVVEQSQTTTPPPISSGNTTADIANDLSQTPDATAALNADAAASAQDVSGL